MTPLKKERNRLRKDAIKRAEKRNTIHEKIRNLRKEASSNKEKRDTINKKVQELKNLRDKVKGKRKETQEQILELQKKIKVLNEEKPKGNLRQVEREIENIDWKIQTTSLTLKEEQSLVNKVRQLEAQLSVQRQIKEFEEKLVDLYSIRKKFEIETKILHEELSELAEQSQIFHEQMIAALDKTHEFQVEANNFHQKYVETKQQAQMVHRKCVEIEEKIRTIRKELTQEANKQEAERQSEIQKELEKRALAKLKSGKKLLWEEFQILAEKGML